jgi:hypothetical protein
MFNHPYISSQIAQNRHREKLASAEQQQRARQFRAQSRPVSRPAPQPAQDGQPLLRALRTAARLRLATRSAARRPEFAREQAGPAGWNGQDDRLAKPDTIELAAR